jgi:circadian clock protein KaiB
MAQYSFTLYIYNDSPHSQVAVDNIMWLCEYALKGDCSIAIVDVAEQPHVAERENILATPTLVKISPKPEQRLIGDLGDKALVLRLLGLKQFPDSDEMDDTA